MIDSVSNRRWQVKDTNITAVEVLQKELGISRLLAMLLVNRNIKDPQEGTTFLQAHLKNMHSPFLLKDMSNAVDRIMKAIFRGEKIFIFGDYDVDGVTATAILLEFFKKAKTEAGFYIPKREAGYGMSRDGVDKAKEFGATVVITVDCGITDMEPVEYCHELGIDVIITDHHQLGERLPSALAIINPQQPDCSYPFKHLAGVGVAFNLLIALRSSLREEGFWQKAEAPNLRQYLDLVSLGTVADMVPLIDQNRIYVKYGIKELACSKRPGVIALKEISGIYNESELDVSAIGFRLAPRINATGRIGSAEKAVRLLTTEDIHEAYELAKLLDEKNRRRQQLVEKIFKEAEAQIMGEDAFIQGRSLVLASPDWHHGVVGIVASRLVEKYNKPAILICLEDGIGRGSARSIPGFDLFSGLQQMAHHLMEFGGHKQAAGLTLQHDSICALRQEFENYTRLHIKEDDLIPCIEADAYLEIDKINAEILSDIDMLKPHGFGNPEPLFIDDGLEVTHWKIVGDGHLKMKLNKRNSVLDAIGFGLGGYEVNNSANLTIVFAPQINEWQGRRMIQLKLKDIKTVS